MHGLGVFRLCLLLIATVISNCSFANEGVLIYPLKAIFYQGGPGAAKSKSQKSAIDGLFDQSYRKNQNELVAIFLKEMHEKFPNVVDNVDQNNLSQTFIASVQVARASVYLIEKPDGTGDLYIPVTASLYLTNVTTGDVIYAKTKTNYLSKTVSLQNHKVPDDLVKDLFKMNLSDLIREFVSAAKQEFNPYVVTANVKKVVGDQLVLDKGSKDGIGLDSKLQSDKAIVGITYVDKSYSIGKAETLLGIKPENITQLSKYSNQTIDEIQKPRVLVIPPAAGDFNYPEESLAQLIGDGLGAKAPIALINFNSVFSNIIDLAITGTKIAAEYKQQRAVPDYYLRVHVPILETYILPTELQYKQYKISTAVVLFELVDQSGRIIWSGSSRERIQDEETIVKGSAIGFSNDARKEVVLKNAITSLTNRLSSELKIERSILTVERSDGQQMFVTDKSGLLVQGENTLILRPIDGIPGIADYVYVPVVDGIVGERKEGSVSILPSTSDSKLFYWGGAPLNQAGDVVRAESLAVSNQVGNRRFYFCGNVEQISGNQMKLSEYFDLAVNAYPRKWKEPIFIKDFYKEVGGIVGRMNGFKEDVKKFEINSEYCVEPAYKIERTKQDCLGEAPFTCSTQYRLVSSLRIKKGSDYSLRKAVEGAFVGSQVPKTAAQPVQLNELKGRIEKVDVYTELLKLGEEVSAVVSKSPFN